MAKLKSRDFTYKGIKFHLNDRRYNNEFTPKYLLMYFHEGFGQWREIGHVESKAEAMRVVKQDYESKCGCFTYI